MTADNDSNSEFKNLSEKNTKEFDVITHILYPKDLGEKLLDKKYVFEHQKKETHVFNIFATGIVIAFSIVDYPDYKRFLEKQIEQSAYNIMLKLIDIDKIQEKFIQTCYICSNLNQNLPLVELFWNILLNYNGLGADGIYTNSIEYSNGVVIFFVSNKQELLTEPIINSLELIRKQRIKKLFITKPKPKKRTILGKSLRHEVFKKCNYKCVECGATKETTQLHVDHIIPVSRDGSDELDNLQILCIDCNLAKKNKIFQSRV